MIGWSLFLLAAGLLMLVKPSWLWAALERWKSEDATEPSSLYLWNTRLGGAICALIGLAGLIVLSLD